MMSIKPSNIKQLQNRAEILLYRLRNRIEWSDDKYVKHRLDRDSLRKELNEISEQLEKLKNDKTPTCTCCGEILEIPTSSICSACIINWKPCCEKRKLEKKHMNGIIILQPYADQIINGIKKYEYRSRQTTKLNIPVYLLSNKKCLGIIKFTKCEKSENNTKYNYSWKVKVLEKFKEPKPYIPIKGAQIWIKDVKFI